MSVIKVLTGIEGTSITDNQISGVCVCIFVCCSCDPLKMLANSLAN